MKLRTNHSLIRAHKVKALIAKAVAGLGFSSTGGSRIGSYQNGREQGLSLSLRCGIKYCWLAWAEARCSDSIVIYRCELDPMQSITEEAYQNGMYFTDEQAAADYIVDVIREVIA